MMENKSTFDNAVALVRCRSDANSLTKALDLYQGLQGNPANTQFLYKPKRHLVEKYQSKPTFDLKDSSERGKQWNTRRLN